LFHLDLISSTEVSVSSEYSKILITIPDTNIFVKLYFILLLIKLLVNILERYENYFKQGGSLGTEAGTILLIDLLVRILSG